jgi:hypothetical protein
MSKAFSYYGSPGLRPTNSFSNNDSRDIEMHPLTQPTTSRGRTLLSSASASAPSTATSTAQKMIQNLSSNTPWNDRLPFGNHRIKKEKRKGSRSRFKVDVPTRLIFHLIIFFFFIPLTIGTLLLIRALFFGLKEDEEHPLHKKLPHSHKIPHNDLVSDVSKMSNFSDVGGGMVEENAVHSHTSAMDELMNEFVNGTKPIDFGNVHNTKVIDTDQMESTRKESDEADISDLTTSNLSDNSPNEVQEESTVTGGENENIHGDDQSTSHKLNQERQ